MAELLQLTQTHAATIGRQRPNRQAIGCENSTAPTYKARRNDTFLLLTVPPIHTESKLVALLLFRFRRLCLKRLTMAR